MSEDLLLAVPTDFGKEMRVTVFTDKWGNGVIFTRSQAETLHRQLGEILARTPAATPADKPNREDS